MVDATEAVTHSLAPTTLQSETRQTCVKQLADATRQIATHARASGESLPSPTQPSQHHVTACLSLQQAIGSLLSLQGQEQMAGFASSHVTTGTHVFCWAQLQPSVAAKIVPSKLLGSIHRPTSSAQIAGMLELQTHVQNLLHGGSGLPPSAVSG